MHSSLTDLAARIGLCMTLDQADFIRRLRALERRFTQHKPIDQGVARLASDIAASQERCERRRRQLPQPTYPEQLPISEHREEIRDAIAAHPVVIIAGETGSGKTTQLPKICLELGRGVAGMIGHTQPRRLAARSLAVRVASELRSEVGHAVGYKVRFTDRLSPDSYIKIMTDGILLAETQGDRELLAYDTLIIDEAHERSLNIDFLLGYVKQLLRRRPGLKVVITSATIDTARFSRHFDDAPVIEVSGRTYPVEVRYRPLTDDEEARDQDLPQAVLAAIDELGSLRQSGHVLVFLPGEREIREVAEHLRKHHPPGSEILPLYARLSAAEQNRIFEPTTRRRIILATNVAETSLTVPGVRYVVDSGLARLSRYSYRSKVQRLPVEPISRASADQRKGRCGRTGPGVCIRLYAEDDYLTRPQYTDPEIRRTNLAAVILRMLSLAMGEVEDFPFLEPPDTRQVSDGYRLLQELGAVDEARTVTALGRQMAALPCDPRVARMIVAAQRERCLSEVLIIAAAISVQDPRERPAEAQQSADERHRLFQDERSDFLSFHKLWQQFMEQKRHLSTNKLRAYCRQNYLSFVRMQEWLDIHHQLLGLVKDMGFQLNEEPADYASLHRALLTGLIGNIGTKSEEREYLGTRNRKFHIHPGSALFRKAPPWVMAAELVETARLYARTVGRIEPEWVEQVAPQLCKRQYLEPHWEKKRAQVVAYERVTLYGLAVVARRPVHFGPLAPVEAREIFIREALVGGELRTQAPFFAHNQRLLAEIEALEHKSRRRDVLVDDETLYRFYDERLPADIYSGILFEQWWKRLPDSEMKNQFLTRDYLIRDEAGQVTSVDFPDRLDLDGLSLKLSYRFEPGHVEDGVTVTVPVAVLNQLKPERFEWLVPGLLREKIVHLLKSLPKSLRRNFIPVPDYADACLRTLNAMDSPLTQCLARELRRMTGVELDPRDWENAEIPPHLRMNFRVVGEDGKAIAVGRDLSSLQRELTGRVAAVFKTAAGEAWNRENLVSWDFAELPREVQIERNGLAVRAYPALIDNVSSVALRLVETPEAADRATTAGMQRLAMFQLSSKLKYLRKNLPDLAPMCLHYASLGSCAELTEDLLRAMVDSACLADRPAIRDAASFSARMEECGAHLAPKAGEVCSVVGKTLTGYHALAKDLKAVTAASLQPTVNDLRQQLDSLVYKGFVAATPFDWLRHYPRYIEAARQRLRKAPSNVERDRQHMCEITRLWQLFQDRAVDAESVPLRWWFEELRVSLYAQELKTSVPISVARLERALLSKS